jgi:hypothetical protein
MATPPETGGNYNMIIHLYGPDSKGGGGFFQKMYTFPKTAKNTFVPSTQEVFYAST